MNCLLKKDIIRNHVVGNKQADNNTWVLSVLGVRSMFNP